jgi:predicted AlkP superfamily phosphohydrolase/phosphomutase
MLSTSIAAEVDCHASNAHTEGSRSRLAFIASFANGILQWKCLAAITGPAHSWPGGGAVGCTSPAPKALIIGIDGGSLDIIDRLVAAGGLPNLSSLIGRGVSARTACTWPAHTAPGWSSFVTASSPGGHGIYQFFDTQDRGYGAAIRQSGDLGRTSIWDWLARQGWTLGLVNIPMSHPPRDLPGYQITWPLARTLRYCRPPGILGELTRQGAHFQPDLATMFTGDLHYIDMAAENVRARLRSVIHLMGTRPADAVMVVFTEVDRVCHHYWHFWDPDHSRHDAPAEPGWETAVSRIYAVVDDAIGELVAQVDEDTTLMVVSDHGLGIGRHEVALNALLEQAGLLVTVPGGDGAAGHGMASWFTGAGRQVDFSRTLAYSPVPGSYGVNLNLAGRQRDGIVHDASAITAEVISLMEGVQLPGGEGPAFRAVVPREAAYPGACMASAPDLLLIPWDESVLATSGVGGPVWSASVQTGLHRYAGLWIEVSPRIRPGRVEQAVPLVDLAPTLLTDIGANWPSNVHGKPVMQAFGPEADVPPPSADLDQAEPGPVPGSRDDDRRAEDEYTTRRLREMGYI